MYETIEQSQGHDGSRSAAPTPQVRIPHSIPLIPGGPTVMYPQQLMPVLATDQRDIEAIGEAAASETKMLGVFAQFPQIGGNYEGELHKLGTAATIVRMAKAPDGTVHA